MTSRDPAPTSASLEHRLPLMISGLLAVTVAAFGFFAFSEVQRASQNSATEQLRTILNQSADNSNRNLAARLAALSATAAAPIVKTALQPGVASDTSTVARFLESHRTAADTVSFVSQLLIDKAGTPALTLGKSPADVELAELQRLVATVAKTDSAANGELFSSSGEVHFWEVAPVRSGAAIAGYVAEQRRLRVTPLVEKQIKDLTGQEINLSYASEDADKWITSTGQVIPARFNLKATADSFQLKTSDGQRVLGVKTAVRTTPWVLVFTIPEAAVNRRAYAFLQNLLIFGVILLAVSVFVARLIGRSVTTPLKALTTAAQDIADGDFARREHVERRDELGQLANAFNTMAERIGQSHTALDRGMRESQALATQLHERNAALEVAQRLATEARMASDRARADAQQASKAKSDFLAMMSHELRTPLSAIAGYAELLQLGLRGVLNDEQRVDVGRIQANQVHLLRIINDILDLAQVESGQLQVESKPVALADVLAGLEPIILPLVESRGVVYRVSPEVPQIFVLAERERLTQVLVNLVANAARFTEPGGDICIHAERQNGFVQIQVTDTGMGIPAEKQELIFQPFIQLDAGASRRAQGTGLGLTISRRIAEALGGNLTLKSEMGVGSTFTLEIAEAVHATSNDVVAHSAVTPVKATAAKALA